MLHTLTSSSESEPLSEFDIPTPTPGPPGRRAEKEAQATALGLDLEAKSTESQLNKISRADKRDGHLHRVVIAMIYFLAAMLALLIFAVVISLLFAEFWLNSERIEEIKSLLLTGGVGAALASVSNKYLFTDQSDH